MVEDINQNENEARIDYNQYQLNCTNQMAGGIKVYEQNNNQINQDQENVYTIVDGGVTTSYNQGGICIEDTDNNYMGMNQNNMN